MCILTEQREIRRIKTNLKRVLSKTLSQNKIQFSTSNLITLFTSLVNKQISLEGVTSQNIFFLGATLKSSLQIEKSIIPTNVLRKFEEYQKTLNREYQF